MNTLSVLLIIGGAFVIYYTLRPTVSAASGPAGASGLGPNAGAGGGGGGGGGGSY